LRKHTYMQGFVLKALFKTSFPVQKEAHDVDPSGSKFQTATGLPVRRSTRHNCRILSKQLTPARPFPGRNTSYVTTP
jgi:hypothetical protein